MTRDPSPARRPRTRARRPNFRPRLEALEQRCLLSAGALDTTFGGTGFVRTDFSEFFDRGDTGIDSAAAVAIEPSDGKIVAAGTTLSATADAAGDPTRSFSKRFAVARYNLDGSLDTTFGQGGKATSATTSRTGTALAIRPDNGWIAVVGHTYTYATGFLDYDYGWSVFDAGGREINSGTFTFFPGRAVELPSAAVFQPDGKLVVAGGAYGGDNRVFRIAFSPVGGGQYAATVETSFAQVAPVNFTGLALQGDKILAGGVNPYGDALTLVRYNADGTPDNSFGTGGQVAVTIPQIYIGAAWMAVQPDGKIVLAGTYQGPPGGDGFALVRFDANGNLDSSFGTAGTVLTPGSTSVEGVAVQRDGKIVVTGIGYYPGSGEDRFTLTRWNVDGSLDGSFGVGGTVITPTTSRNDLAYGVAIAQDGKIVVAGDSESPTTGTLDDFGVARYVSDSTTQPVLALTAANAAYTGAPYDTANLTATVMPAAAPGSVSYVFYSDAGGQNAIADPTNAGTYYVRAVFTSSDPARFTNATSAIVPFTITAKSLSVDATTQGTINIAKAGTISFALQITAGLVASNNNVAALFNGATFTITVGGTSYSLTSTATVAPDGTINVSMRMSQGLQDALLTALSEGNTVDFSLSALSNDGDYSVDADAISRLISQGKLKYAVV